MDNLPNNKFKMSGQKWTREEEKELLLQLSAGKSIQEIAGYHNRSEIAIQLRLASLIQDKLKTESMRKIATELKLNETIINKLLTKLQSYSEKSDKSEKMGYSSVPNATDYKIQQLEEKLNSIEKYCKLIYKKLSKK